MKINIKIIFKNMSRKINPIDGIAIDASSSEITDKVLKI